MSKVYRITNAATGEALTGWINDIGFIAARGEELKASGIPVALEAHDRRTSNRRVLA